MRVDDRQSVRLIPGRWEDVLLHLVLPLFLGVLLLFEVAPATILETGGLLAFPLYLVLATREMRRSPLLFTPLSFYLFWHSIALGPSAIYVGNLIASGAPLSFSVFRLLPRDIAIGYIIFLVGSVSLHAGLQALRPSIPSEDDGTVPGGRRYIGWLVFFWALGLWSHWNPQIIAPLGTAVGVLVSRLALAALCIFALTPRRRMGLSRMSFAVMFFVGTMGIAGANLMSGSKAILMFSFLPLVWLMLIRPRLRRWLPVVGVSLAVLYLFVIAPVVNGSRSSPLWPGETQAERLVDTFLRHMQGDLSEHGAEPWDKQIESFLHRQFVPFPLGYFVADVNTYGYQEGEFMGQLAYAFIPRLFWPDKPTVTRGAWFAYFIGFARSEEDSTMSLGMSATGDLYWNFGILGVIGGMFVFGCLYGKLWRMTGMDPRKDLLRMLFYVNVMMNMVGMPDAVSVLVTITIYFVMFKLLEPVFRILQATRENPGAAFAS